MAAVKVPLIFRLFKGDQFIREERITSAAPIKIGKLSSSHLRMEDETVSRMHAVIETNGPDDISIIDLGSTTGTFVNGQKINKAKLQPGDNIVVGNTRIDFAIGSAEDAAVETPQPTVDPSFDAAARSAPPTNAPPFAAAPLPPAARPGPSTPPPMASAPPPAAVRPPPAFASAPAPFATAAAAPTPFQQMNAEAVDDLGGARAVEVAAMLGDSVVAVKHVMNPRGGKVSGGTYGMFAFAAVNILLALVMFFSATRTAAQNKAASDEWTTVLKRPSYAFRPTMISPVNDAIVFTGFLVGMICVVVGLSRRRRELESNPFFRIGSDADVEFPTATSPSASFALIAPQGDEFVLNYGHGMDGEMVLDGQTSSFADLQASGRARASATAAGAFEMAIPPRARIRVRNGNNTFMVSSVPQPRRQAVSIFAGAEAMVLAYFLGSAVVHLGFVWLLSIIGPSADNAIADASTNEDVSTDSNSTSKDDPPPPKPEDSKDNSNDESGGTGTAMALDEGKMGKKDSTRAEGQYKMAKTQDQEQLARQQAVDAARTAGVLGSTALQQGGAFASLTGTGDTSSGFDDANIYGGLLGNEAGEMNGGSGFGRSGFGPGGGGTGWGTIGTGRYGTIGHGSGTGNGYGVGGGRGGMHGRPSAVPAVQIGQPTSNGDLDKAIIRRYIKRNIQKITYCYEKQLVAKPGLAGTVQTQFFIAPGGNVQSANASGVDGEVASCVADVLKSIEFPKPKGGGGVNVNYPFIFRPTGG